jgi:multidrug efflux pump subunit AcrA (membrane-fusion protein)
MEKGQGESRQIAEMELMNVQARYDALQALHAQHELQAPFAGLILRPPEKTENQADSSPPLQAGQLVKQGAPLLVLASTERLNAVAKVEEADLHQLSENMPVEVTGDGFEGDTLKGRIVTIGLQGKSEEGSRGDATYDVTVSIDPLPPKQQKRVRLWMSARLTVVTYRAKKGFAVPPDVVRRDENGQSFVMHRQDMNDAPKRIAVTTGHAVPQGVEVFGVKGGYVESPADGH